MDEGGKATRMFEVDKRKLILKVTWLKGDFVVVIPEYEQEM